MGSMSLTPVTLAPGASASATSPAPTGSVTAVNTIGVVVSAFTTACVVGVATPRIEVEALAGELLRRCSRPSHVALGVLVVIGDVGEALLRQTLS